MLGKIIKTTISVFPALFTAVKIFISQLKSSQSLDIFTFDEVIIWLKTRKELKTSDDDNIAFTLLEKHDEQYQIVIGIYNKLINEILDGEIIMTKQIDEKLKDCHSNNELVIYE